MAKKDSTILYHDQMAIVRKWLDAEQIGRLMIALFEFEEGGDPQVDDDIGMAFDFLTLQAKIDREKYEEKCRKNRENGAKGGAPKGNKNASKQPKQPNAKKNNPNDNDNDNDNEAGAAVHSADSDLSFFGEHENVELTDEQRQELMDKFERSGALIDEVSDWIHNAKNHVPDHYGLCVRWAKNAGWPKRRKIEPVKPIIVEDPLSEEEQREKVADMRARLNGAFEAG